MMRTKNNPLFKQRKRVTHEPHKWPLGNPLYPILLLKVYIVEQWK